MNDNSYERYTCLDLPAFDAGLIQQRKLSGGKEDDVEWSWAVSLRSGGLQPVSLTAYERAWPFDTLFQILVTPAFFLFLPGALNDLRQDCFGDLVGRIFEDLANDGHEFEA